MESDSLNTIRAITEQQQNHSYLGVIVEDCVSLFSGLHSLQFSHIKRVSSQVPNYLAKDMRLSKGILI